MDLYLNAPDENAVRRLINSQLAVLDPESVNEPGRWTPHPFHGDWDVEELVEQKMILLAPYAATPGGEPKKPLDNDFTSDLLRLNEGLQPFAEIDDYPLGTVASWATAGFRECLESSGDLFRPLFATHPELKEEVRAVERWYPWYSGPGLYVRPGYVSRARLEVEASLRGEAGEWYDADEFALNAILELADLLRFAERRGQGLIERIA